MVHRITIIAVILHASIYFPGCGVIRTSPSFFDAPVSSDKLPPVMSMTEYNTIAETHARPYIYTITSSNGGKVTIAGIEHTKDKNNPQLDSLKRAFQNTEPTVALVEGRLGFLFSWSQDPVEVHGEGGLTVQLAKEKGIPFYTWEPRRETEIKILLNSFTPLQLAAFYSFRPYFGNMRFGKPANPEETLQDYINSRTDYEGLRNVLTNWNQLDSLWKADYPNEKDWRDYSDEYGWPEGYFSELFNASNNVRDEHLCNIIFELVRGGENVFVSVGASHAPRIEARLKAGIK